MNQYQTPPQPSVPQTRLPSSYKLLMIGCVMIASLGYVWDGVKQKSSNACMERIESNKKQAIAAYGKAGERAISKKKAAQYAGYLAQNSDRLCDGL